MVLILYYSDIGSVEFLAEQAAAADVFESEDAAKKWLETDELKEVSYYHMAYYAILISITMANIRMM